MTKDKTTPPGGVQFLFESEKNNSTIFTTTAAKKSSAFLEVIAKLMPMTYQPRMSWQANEIFD